MRRQLAKGVRMYTGDDFNYAELIAGDDKGYSDALLGIFDAIAPAASAALTALAAGDRARFDAILAPTVPLSRHIFKAPTRFYKTGVVFMAYLNGLQDHFVMVGGQQSARSILAPGRAVPPRRPRRAAARPGPGPPAHGARAGRARDRLMRGHLRGRPLAHLLDQHGDGAQAARAARHHRGLRPARHPRHRPLARPGAGGGPRAGRPAGEGRRPRALGLLPRRLLPGGRRRGPAGRARGQPPRRRRGQDARRALPGAGGGRAAGRARPASRPAHGHRARARPGARRHRRHAGVRARRRHAARHRAAASRCRRPSAPASTRWSRRSTSATRSIPAAAARSASRSTSITCGGTPSSRQQIARAGRERLLAYHVCDWLVPTRDLLNDRGMMGDGIIELKKIRGWVEAAGYTGHVEVEIFSDALVEPPRRRGARHLHRALPDGGVSCHAGACRPASSSPRAPDARGMMDPGDKHRDDGITSIVSGFDLCLPSRSINVLPWCNIDPGRRGPP